MVARPVRPAFYAPAAGGRLADTVTLLHPPYTLWHLSYYALGAALAPHVFLDRLLWGLLAFPLAVGVAAHALDELHDRPLHTGFSDRALRAVAILSLLGAVAIGIGGIVSVSGWLAPLVLAGGLLVPAYNLELGGGRFHSDIWFALGWGAFPAFTGYFVNALEVSLAGVLVALGCMTMSIAQRRLSSAARGAAPPHRRRARRARTHRRQHRAALRGPAARAARRRAGGALAAMPLLAAALLAARL